MNAICQFLDLWAKLLVQRLATHADRWTWKWTLSGTHSTKTAYDTTFTARTHCGWESLIWQPWAPMKFKYFAWLVLRNRTWTSDRLARRDLPHQAACPLCC